MGAILGQGQAFTLDWTRVKAGSDQTIAQRDTLIEARFAGTSTSFLLTSTQNAASQAEAAASTLTQMGAVLGNGSAFTLTAERIKVTLTESLAERVSLIENRFGATASSVLLTRTNSAVTDSTAALDTLTQMGVTVNQGAAWNLSAAKVLVAPGELLSQRLESVGVKLGTEIESRIDTRITTGIGPGGPIAEYVTSAIATGQGAVARFILSAEASGSRPALLTLESGGGSSNIALRAAEVFFGDNTVFDDASNTFQSVANGRRFILGGPFGAEGLTQWLGDAALSASSASRANANFYVATTQPRIGGSDFPTGGLAGATRRRASTPISGTQRANAVNFGQSGAALLDVNLFLGSPQSASQNVSGIIFIDQGAGNSWSYVADVPFTITSEGAGIYSVNPGHGGALRPVHHLA
jgi:hypothetical protein